ncbi:ABC transporter ATP-binding protein [Kallotenue papyrolyticum]|uniref:ABC transporter ATP-binding protein n=1 Tax=Kallotenue papyrolyticum TaxID=1325125 RepID=UPI00046EE05F|nr:ABC transporter ATP-binding protein [Kallotenue papyrolyticum]
MADLELRTITKRFGRITALDGVSFSVRDGEFFVLLGPSGAGKTTTLRVVAGLERPEQGRVLINGEDASDWPPAQRDVAFVFQQYSLYPTMSVYDNLAFPLRSPLRRVPEAVIRQRIHEVAEKLRIAHLLERKTARLSGGEMQRVAIGRAMVRDPQLFLMDEPLSNLDAKLREALRVELKHVQKTRGSTTLFVTHDQIEALTMADRIAVLEAGRIVQIGTPYDIYDRPATTFVAQLVGAPRINLLPAEPSDGALCVPDSPLRLPLEHVSAALPERLTLGVRPEDVRLDPQGPFVGEIALVEPLGPETLLHLRVGAQMLISTLAGMPAVERNTSVRFTIPPRRVHVFGPDGRRLAGGETP